MLVVGLTGGIASGKSTVSALLKAHGVPVIDADVLAREAVVPGSPGLRKIIKAFGHEILLPDGTLDRKKLGSIVFADAGQRRVLNGIVHPAVRWGMFWGVVRCWVRGERMCVLDVPLLVEGGLWKWVGKVLLVYCSPEIQLQRLMKRDGSLPDDARARLNAQLPIADKVAFADVVIDNSGSRDDIAHTVSGVLARLERELGWGWRVSWLVPPLGIAGALLTLAARAWARRGRAQGKKKQT